MLRFVVLVSSLACSLATTWYREHRPCECPANLVGLFTVSNNGMERAFYYDPELQRMAIFTITNHTDLKIRYDYLLYFQEGVMYDINQQTSKCSKRPLNTDYRPVGVPEDAQFVTNFNIGGPSSPGGGYAINVWEGLTPREEHYKMVVSESECLPIMTTYNTREFGEVFFVFLDNFITPYPFPLIVPLICRNLDVRPGDKPVDFLSLFIKKQQQKRKQPFFTFKYS